MGCGAIGTALAEAIERDDGHRARIVALTDADPRAAQTLRRRLAGRPAIVSLPELIRRSMLVVEAASGAIAARVARLALASHRDVLIMSTGGLLTDTSWQRAARRSRGRLVAPSGALAGIDGAKAMAIGTIRRIRLTTTKPPRALTAAPWVHTHRWDLSRLRTRKTLFEGPPAAAVKAFPQNANVAATLALACLPRFAWRRQAAHSSFRSRPPRITVRIVADPSARVNRHEVDVEGDCGRLHTLIESRPSKNPKTSEVAIRSAVAALQGLMAPIQIGT